jgi:23S rRNA (cytidine1920-2'-O)/16S rRNA (cytidine1409-2'-O)-methyltransferase
VDAIRGGRVLVAGVPATSPARQVSGGEPIVVAGPAPRFVSRGGDKLAAALERFDIDVAGRRALDAGASTGGFTDCLLWSGAAHVYAVDVGRGQLAWSLRCDPRVTVLERTNVRELDPGMLGGPVDVCTADLSFISLVAVAPALMRCTVRDAALVLLVKPQFEAGRERVARGGLVRDASIHTDVVGEVAARLADAGLGAIAVGPSSLRGADGNIEFFLHCRHGPLGIDERDVTAAVAEAHGQRR